MGKLQGIGLYRDPVARADQRHRIMTHDSATPSQHTLVGIGSLSSFEQH